VDEGRCGPARRTSGNFGLVGESGSGKTTLARCIASLLALYLSNYLIWEEAKHASSGQSLRAGRV
jgi:ABC-type glutathione transport system ATPase component